MRIMAFPFLCLFVPTPDFPTNSFKLNPVLQNSEAKTKSRSASHKKRNGGFPQFSWGFAWWAVMEPVFLTLS